MRPELERVIREVEKVIAGKREAIEKMVMALLADGHVLLDDVPGVGKTTLAIALSRAVGLQFQRIQCTPDLLPSDIVGFSMPDGEGGFRYCPGAVTQANLVLVDEINRGTSKTQSALLEAMEERQVTVDGRTYPLEEPFMVIATENSVGTAGTQMLPYAQMDRFLIRMSLGYPDYEAQMTMLRDRQNRNPVTDVAQALEKGQISALQEETRKVTVRDGILDYITRLSMASREHEAVEVGISPRGALHICAMAKARACAEGRDYATGGDVQDVFFDVCGHRVLLKESAGGMTVEQVLAELLKKVENPDRHGLFPGMKKK